MAWIRPHPDGVVLSIRVTPNARQDVITAVRNDALCIKLQAPPVEGKANHHLVKFLARTLAIRASSITIVKGATARTKAVAIAGQTASAVQAALEERIPSS